jgi:DNA-binding Lrp family transcriptional regulator
LKKTSAKQKENLLLKELLKDSSRSDRELSNTLGTSQPTVSRLRKKLVENKIIKHYTVIPNFYKMGFRIMAVTLIKSKHNLASEELRKQGYIQAKKWMEKQPNIIFCDYCRGLGKDGLMISFHKSYNDFDKFMASHNHALGNLLENFDNLLINIGEKESIKPFSLEYLSELL